MSSLKRKDLIYPELSYEILKCAYCVHNTLGGALPEKDYQQALAHEFKQNGIKFIEQYYIEMEYKGKIIKRFCDFLVDDKIIIEIKSVNRILYKDFQQTRRYLVFKKLQLAILLVFGREQVSQKRVLNL